VRKSINQAFSLLNNAASECFKHGLSSMLEKVGFEILNLNITRQILLGQNVEDQSPDYMLPLELSRNLRLQRELTPRVSVDDIVKLNMKEFALPNNFQKIQDSLPKNWKVISLSYDVRTSTLIIHNIQLKSRRALKLPLNRHEIDTLLFQTAIDTFDDIIKESKATTTNVNLKMSKSEKQQWWTKRKKLNSSLEKLLSDIENEWFCGLKVGFSSFSLNVFRDFYILNTMPLMHKNCIQK
jgi:hypothetical protein